MDDRMKVLFGIAAILILYGLLLESHHKASQRIRLIEALIKNLERKNSSLKEE